MTQVNLPTEQKQTHRQREQICGCQGGGGGRGMEEEVRVSRCKLLYTERINNEVLLYSTENYIQRPMINHIGKEYFLKGYTHIYNNHFAV